MKIKALWQRWMLLWNSLPRAARIGILFLVDAALIGIGLCIFAYFHHVIPREEVSLGTVSTRGSAAAVTQPTAAPSAEQEAAISAANAVPEAEPALASNGTVAQPTLSPAATPDPVGYFGTKFADKFTDGEIVNTIENGVGIYRSPNLNLTGTTYTMDKLVYHVIDIYVKDISYLQSAFANNKYGRGQRDDPANIAAQNNAIAAINGDYYSARSEGVVLRNGELFREGTFGDVCVLYWDGTMETFSAMGFNLQNALDKGAYQIWNFGPMLLDSNGQTMTEFDSSVTGNNPRSVIGYFEPGHYCFVAVDGRSSASKGLSMSKLSQLMYDLGCKSAYNLDGGQTSQLIWNGNVINDPYKGGRECSDIIMVAEP